MNGAAWALRQKRQVDARGLHRRQLDLRLACRLAHALQGGGFAAQVDAVVALELVEQVFRHALVEVVAAQVVVAGGREHLDDAVADLDDGHVERAAAQVVDHHLLGRAVVQAVGERGGRGLVDDAQHVEPGDAAGVLGGLALHVVEVGGHGDDRVGDGLAEERLGVGAQLAQDHRRQLLGREALPVDVDAPIGAHVALDRGDRAVGVHRRLAARDAPDQALARFGERDHAGGGALAFGVGDDDGLAALHRRHAAIGRSQIDAYRRSHARVLSIRGLT